MAFIASVKSAFVPGASRMWRNLASWMYGRGVLCKRSRKSFHPRSIDSLPKVDPLFYRLSEPAFRKQAYTVTETLHTWNVASNTTKVECISLSDSKCRKIKDSSSSARLPNWDDTRIDSVSAVSDQVNSYFCIFIVLSSYAANVLQSQVRRTVVTDAFNVYIRFLRYTTVTVRKSFVAMKLSRIHVNWPDLS